MHFNKLQFQPQKGGEESFVKDYTPGQKGKNEEIIWNNDAMYCILALLWAQVRWMEPSSQMLTAVLLALLRRTRPPDVKCREVLGSHQDSLLLSQLVPPLHTCLKYFILKYFISKYFKIFIIYLFRLCQILVAGTWDLH